MRSRYEEIGGLFRKIREENGLKQSQMAEIADCSLRNYQNIELGITQPGYNILRNIVHNLPLDPRELFVTVPESDERSAKTERIKFILSLCSDWQLHYLCSMAEKLIRVQKANGITEEGQSGEADYTR